MFNSAVMIHVNSFSWQEHIEALYSYVEKLQESKADKENVAMEMNIKADKAALDSKVNVSTFDNTFNMLDEGLREALQKMDDYMNEEMALKQALKQLSVDMSEKMDGHPGFSGTQELFRYVLRSRGRKGDCLAKGMRESHKKGLGRVRSVVMRDMGGN